MVCRTWGATPEMAKWICDYALTLSPLQISILCTPRTMSGGQGRAGEEGLTNHQI